MVVNRTHYSGYSEMSSISAHTDYQCHRHRRTSCGSQICIQLEFDESKLHHIW